MYEADRVFPGGKGVQAFRFDMGVAAVRNFQIFSVFEKNSVLHLLQIEEISVFALNGFRIPEFVLCCLLQVGMIIGILFSCAGYEYFFLQPFFLHTVRKGSGRNPDVFLLIPGNVPGDLLVVSAQPQGFAAVVQKQLGYFGVIMKLQDLFYLFQGNA